METKICCTCKEEKRIEGFSKNKASKDGFKQYCKMCARVQTKKYRDKYRDEINARNKEWYYESKSKREERTQKEIAIGYRICSECNQKKDIENFYQRGNGGFYGECKDCHNKKVKIYVDKNREVVLDRKRNYYLRTHEYHVEYFRKYSLENSERNVERAKRWAKANPDKARRSGVMAFHRRRAKLSKVKSDFTRKDWDFCKDFFRNEEGLIECAYCNKKLKNATQEHFVPIHKNGDHTATNILPVCKSCNSRKSATDFHIWYPSMPFYSEKNVIKIQDYFNSLKQNHDNHEPSASETM